MKPIVPAIGFFYAPIYWFTKSAQIRDICTFKLAIENHSVSQGGIFLQPCVSRRLRQRTPTKNTVKPQAIKTLKH